MSNIFTNFLDSVVNASGDMKDYQHAARLYVDNFYELAPKTGWIYYVVLNINPKMLNLITDPSFGQWYNRYRGNIGLLAKTADLPKFTLQTETLNQYNKKTVIQKQITYSPVSISFHDDMANATTNFWKYYYQYYYGDSVNAEKFSAPTSIIPKYQDMKYTDFNTYRYGLNNAQDTPFLLSIDIYQLYKKKYTSFKLVNPLIKEWAHDNLDQTQGNRMLTSKLTVEYETVIYDTSNKNKTTIETPGFVKDHYDRNPSPLGIGGVGNNSLFGEGGIIAGASEVLGDLQDVDNMSPLDMLNTAIKGANVIKNAKSVSMAGVLQEGSGILTGAIGNIGKQSAGVLNPDGTVSRVPAMSRVEPGFTTGINQSLSPAGINLFNSNSPSAATTSATPRNIG